VSEPHVLTGDAILGFAADWTGRYPVAGSCRRSAPGYGGSGAVLALCTDAGLGGRPAGGQHRPGRRGRAAARRGRAEPDPAGRAEAGRPGGGPGHCRGRGDPAAAEADPELDLGILIASRDSATVGRAVATNAGGVRVLRFGPMRAQLRGIEAVPADGTVVSHLASARGMVKRSS
jgi:hypothetical protein